MCYLEAREEEARESLLYSGELLLHFLSSSSEVSLSLSGYYFCGPFSLQKEEKKLGFSQPQILFQMFTPTNNNYSNYFFPFSSSSSSSSSSSLPLLHPSVFENINASSSSSSAMMNATFYHHDHLSSLPFIPSLIPEPVLTNNLAAPSEYACVVGKQQNIAPDSNVVSGNFIAKKPSKKDRHSKIYTSQGLRDRRVRLSIEIARKFFDLQDMLGFDKASNTLDWLFTKSKKAIQELEAAARRSKKKSSSRNSETNNKSFSSSSSSEEEEECDEEVVSPQRAAVDSDSGKAATTIEKAAKKESREKARARARERTNHKGKSLIMEEPKETEECATVIKRKMKQASSNLQMNSNHHPQNQLVIPNHKELTSFINNNTLINTTTTHDYSIFPNLTTNWDTINGRSNFCTIANMNLSTDLQIYGRSWEECNNQRQH